MNGLTSASRPEGGLLEDRRKAGRIEYINPHLIPLLRRAERKAFEDVDPFQGGTGTANDITTPLEIFYSELNGGRGIALGVIVGGLLWTAAAIALRSVVSLLG